MFDKPTLKRLSGAGFEMDSRSIYFDAQKIIGSGYIAHFGTGFDSLPERINGNNLSAR